jgi:hypothetical protein
MEAKLVFRLNDEGNEATCSNDATGQHCTRCQIYAWNWDHQTLTFTYYCVYDGFPFFVEVLCPSAIIMGDTHLDGATVNAWYVIPEEDGQEKIVEMGVKYQTEALLHPELGPGWEITFAVPQGDWVRMQNALRDL